MPRTTLDIDATVLRELHERRVREGKPLGAIVSQLLAERLATDGPAHGATEPFAWNSRPMVPRVDLEDKEAVYAALEQA